MSSDNQLGARSANLPMLPSTETVRPSRPPSGGNVVHTNADVLRRAYAARDRAEVVRATRADVGRSYEDLHVHAYRFQDGRIIEFWGFLHDPEAAGEFWA
jgi:ketosteroid isomerase-like protein